MQTLLIALCLIVLLSVLGCLIYLIFLGRKISCKISKVSGDMEEYFYCQYKYLSRWLSGEEESQDSKDNSNK